MRDVKRRRRPWLQTAAVLGAALLLVGYEYRFFLVREGMTPEQVERIMGRHDFVDSLTDSPPEEHATYYYEGIFRPYLAVVWGPDGRVRRVKHRWP